MIGYETTYIMRADISDDANKSFLEKLKGIITAYGGQVVGVEDWGKRRLAYAIEKETRGYYTYVMYTGNNELVAELERNLRINEQVMRFLSVKLENDFDTKDFKRKPTPNAVVGTSVAVPQPNAAAVPAPAAE